MKKKIICLGLMLVISMVLFSACAEGSKVKYNVGYRGNHNADSENHSLNRIVYSIEELDPICDERYYTIYYGDGSEEKVYYLKEATEKYNEAYFSDKALVLYLFANGHGANSMRIKALHKENETLFISIHDTLRGNAAGAITYWTFILEVKKSDVIGITNIKTK